MTEALHFIAALLLTSVGFGLIKLCSLPLDQVYKIVVIMGVGAASGTALFAYLNYRTARFTNAIQTYRRYLELAVRYPHLAEPGPHGVDEADPEFVRYEWFVGVLLRACEEVLEHRPIWRRPSVESRWKMTVRSQLDFHQHYFKNNSWFSTQGMPVYSADLQRVIKAVIRG